MIHPTFLLRHVSEATVEYSHESALGISNGRCGSGVRVRLNIPASGPPQSIGPTHRLSHSQAYKWPEQDLAKKLAGQQDAMNKLGSCRDFLPFWEFWGLTRKPGTVSFSFCHKFPCFSLVNFTCSCGEICCVPASGGHYDIVTCHSLTESDNLFKPPLGRGQLVQPAAAT